MAESNLNAPVNSMEPQTDYENGELEIVAARDTSKPEIDIVKEPSEGMMFDSEEAAKSFYDEYARQFGFLTRVLSSRKSGCDGSVISRGFGCRAGSKDQRKGQIQRRYTCSAMILLKKENLGKWVVKKFVRDHNHPLVAQLQKCRRKPDEKDKKIQELTSELRAKKRLSARYKEQLITFMKDIEDHSEHLTSKVQLVFDNLKKLDAERRELIASE